jgi:hypothetical protein
MGGLALYPRRIALIECGTDTTDITINEERRLLQNEGVATVSALVTEGFIHARCPSGSRT